MTEEDSGLFQVRLNEQGKNFIRKFAAISYTILVLVFFGSAVSIYWDIKILVMRTSLSTGYPGDTRTFYDLAYPYISILFSLLTLIGNIYYVRFPRTLLHSIKIGDEFGANQSFKLLFRSALIFLVWLIVNSCTVIWSLTGR